MSAWEGVKQQPPDAILSLATDFEACKLPRKAYLGVGAYRDNNGKPYILESVKKAERYILDHPETYKHEYIAIDGYAPFTKAAREFLFGADHPAVKEGRVYSCQSISGSGALCIAFDTIKRCFPGKPRVLLPNPTWPNHRNLIGHNYDGEIGQYTYLGPDGLTLDFGGMCDSLRAAPEGSIVLLHMCAHNPSGVDLTQEQWKELAPILKEKHFFPLIDGAYQGFATGDFERDAFALRLIADLGIELIVCQSFAKNMGLYGERCGCVHFVVNDTAVISRLASNVKLQIRGLYSSPPCHGAFIAHLILTDPELHAEWVEELKVMSGRIIEMRRLLLEALKKHKAKGNWDHIVSQIGMFSYTGLTPAQCDRLRDEFGVFMTRSGRASIACLTPDNVDYVAECFAKVVE